MVDKLKAYVAVGFHDQATVAARAMEEIKAPTFVNTDSPVRIYLSDEGQTLKTKNRRNNGATKDTVPKTEDGELKFEVDRYLTKYKTYKEGTKAWAENKGKCYYLIFQHYLPELKTELKRSVRWEATATNTDIMALLLIVWDVMHHKKTGPEYHGAGQK